ncbi:MAG: hypothetical protein NDI81_18795 [Desulfobacula sp.]|nr:hypothetical protein [Desulfobacula sp.]
MGVLIVWGVLSFIYYKVALDAIFNYYGISIIAALLLGCMVSLLIFFSGQFYASKMGKHLAKIRLGLEKESNFWAHSLGIWFMTSLLFSVVGKLIIFGFSKKLNRKLGDELFFGGGRYFDETITFLIIILIPLAINYLLIISTVKLQEKIVRDAD